LFCQVVINKFMNLQRALNIYLLYVCGMHTHTHTQEHTQENTERERETESERDMHTQPRKKEKKRFLS